MAAALTALTMAEKLKTIAKWLASHLYVRSRDLQGKRDEFALDECKPKTAIEVGLKLDF